MLKLISILITNGIVLFMLISCHNKTSNSRNTVNFDYENSIDSLNSYKMDISHFINSIEPGETIVEEKQMQGMKIDEWCQLHSITKASYYWRLRKVREAYLEIAEQTQTFVFLSRHLGRIPVLRVADGSNHTSG